MMPHQRLVCQLAAQVKVKHSPRSVATVLKATITKTKRPECSDFSPKRNDQANQINTEIYENKKNKRRK